MSEPAWLKAARADIGLREIPGAPTEPRIAAWLKKLGAWWSLLRLRQGALRSHPALADSLPDQHTRQAESGRRNIQRHVLAEGGKPEGVSLVVELILRKNPSAIAGLVVAVVVDAVQLVSGGRARPHVGKEVLELEPAHTDLDSSPAIVGVSPPMGRQAASLHVRPNPLGWRIGHAVLRNLWVSAPLLQLLGAIRRASRVAMRRGGRHGHGAAADKAVLGNSIASARNRAREAAVAVFHPLGMGDMPIKALPALRAFQSFERFHGVGS